MPPLSLKKIFAAIIGVAVLAKLGDILRALRPVYSWFAGSLDGIRDFEEGAQAAIAVMTLLLVVVVILRVSDNRSERSKK